MLSTDWDVIVVDDVPDNLNVFRIVFGFHRIPYRTAASGMDCLALMEVKLPNLVITDIQMPEMDGIALLERIRANNNWKTIPIIAATAYTNTYQPDKLLQLGFDGVLTKPLSVATTVDDIQAILETHSVFNK